METFNFQWKLRNRLERKMREIEWKRGERNRSDWTTTWLFDSLLQTTSRCSLSRSLRPVLPALLQRSVQNSRHSQHSEDLSPFRRFHSEIYISLKCWRSGDLLTTHVNIKCTDVGRQAKFWFSGSPDDPNRNKNKCFVKHKGEIYKWSFR